MHYKIEQAFPVFIISKVEGNELKPLDLNELPIDSALKSSILISSSLLTSLDCARCLFSSEQPDHPMVEDLIEECKSLPDKIAVELMNPLKANQIDYLDLYGDEHSIMR